VCLPFFFLLTMFVEESAEVLTVAQHMAQHAGYRRLTFGRRCLLVLSAVYRARVNTSDILLGRVGLFSPLLT
jgi:hypothetical protein